MMVQLGVITFEGKEVSLIRHPRVDNFGMVPQAFAWQKKDQYFIFVGIGFLSAPVEVRNWIIAHELGHIRLGHTKSWTLNFLMGKIRNLVPFKPIIDREIAADQVANELTGSANGGILLFNFLKQLGCETVENEKRLAACVAYNERFAK